MTLVTVTRNDDVSIAATLKQDGTALNVSTATDITAALTSIDGHTSYVSAAQSSGSTDADWPNGIVECIFANVNTGLLPKGTIRLEVQVTLGGKKTTWHFEAIHSKVGTIA